MTDFPSSPGSVQLGDIVRMNENYQYYHDWKNAGELKVVSLRQAPDGAIWVSVIEGDQRHRGNGVYDGETTDIDAEHLSVVRSPDEAATPSITDEMVNAAAREMWNDRDARHGGSWDSRNAEEVCVIQTKATARAALAAALSGGAAQPAAATASEPSEGEEVRTARLWFEQQIENAKQDQISGFAAGPQVRGERAWARHCALYEAQQVFMKAIGARSLAQPSRPSDVQIDAAYANGVRAVLNRLDHLRKPQDEAAWLECELMWRNRVAERHASQVTSTEGDNG